MNREDSFEIKSLRLYLANLAATNSKRLDAAPTFTAEEYDAEVRTEQARLDSMIAGQQAAWNAEDAQKATRYAEAEAAAKAHAEGNGQYPDPRSLTQ